MTPTVTARYDEPRIEGRMLCSALTIATVGVELEITYDQGEERDALRALDRAYADAKRQITGMTTLIASEHQEDM